MAHLTTSSPILEDQLNEEGQRLIFYRGTIKQILNKFYKEYYRSGWQIHIENLEGTIVKIIRATFKKQNFHVLHNGYK